MKTSDKIEYIDETLTELEDNLMGNIGHRCTMSRKYLYEIQNELETRKRKNEENKSSRH